MTENEPLQEFVNRLVKQEEERAAQRARQETEYLAFSMWRIHCATKISPAEVSASVFADVQSSAARLCDRIRRNDHGMNEQLLINYVDQAKTWLNAVVIALFKQAGR